MPTPTPRALLVAALTLPDTVRVRPYTDELGSHDRPVVMPYVDEVTRRPEGGPTLRQYQFGLLLVGVKVAPGGGDDDLDRALEDVLHALDQAPGLTWSLAKRSVYEGRLPAYLVTVQVLTTHTP